MGLTCSVEAGVGLCGQRLHDPCCAPIKGDCVTPIGACQNGRQARENLEGVAEAARQQEVLRLRLDRKLLVSGRRLLLGWSPPPSPLPASSWRSAGHHVHRPAVRHLRLHDMQRPTVSVVRLALCVDRGAGPALLTLGPIAPSRALVRSMALSHRVKSVSMGKFTPEEIASLEAGGNQVRCWLPASPLSYRSLAFAHHVSFPTAGGRGKVPGAVATGLVSEAARRQVGFSRRCNRQLARARRFPASSSS